MKNNQAFGTIGAVGRPRILIVGCGDVGLRILPLLRGLLCDSATHRCRNRFRIFATTSHRERAAELRAAGAIPVVVDLDQPDSLVRLAHLARLVIYLAPPASEGLIDQRSRNLAALLGGACRMVYVSTTGVYGDCAGALVHESRPVHPENARAKRRIDAENVWRHWARRRHASLAILRVPGIYAADRLPLERLKAGTPALQRQDDVYTNHIHALDLARLIVRALWMGRPNRLYHATDNSRMLMGDYFDAVADHHQLPRPPRLPRAELARQVSPMMLSFMSESRCMSNARIKHELGFQFLFPDVIAGLNPQHLPDCPE